MMEMLVEASMGVQIPDSDLNEGRASKPIAAAKGVEGSARFAVHVNSSRERPPAGEAFVSVRYPNRWFWLPDRDIGSKRSLGFLMLLSELAESGTTAAPPVLTINEAVALVSPPIPGCRPPARPMSRRWFYFRRGAPFRRSRFSRGQHRI